MKRMNPYGPPGIAEQLQLTFDGIPPLSLEERISDWLVHQHEETADVLTSRLFLADNESRRRRAARWLEVRAIQAPYDTEWGWLINGGVEVSWLYVEACQTYVNGEYFASLLCAHASCERVLAGILSYYSEKLDKGWLMWGLGKLIEAARRLDLVDNDTLNELSKLSEIRKVSAHYKPFISTENSVMRRASNVIDSHPELDDEEVLDDIVRQDAVFGIKAATALVRSNRGFG